RLLSLAQPLTVSALRDTLAELYADPRAAVRGLQREASPDQEAAAPCILVAEDNPVNQLVVQGFLKKRGYSVRLVTNGLAAANEYQRDPAAIQLILMDCEMPVMDGFEATEKIRQMERQQKLAAVPIVALTAHTLDEHRQHGLDVGMDDLLGKPLNSAQLYATLERYLLEQTTPGT
ncbi:response regulator, partial [Pseudomonas sp.]|uniref:response regulator n=1 Tax=Pseudomonas sp. TaxID=306 RepID=UPI0035641162